ncbi:UNKNOWN [Stylonychia lemnae]|uniref:Cadg domain containing protein n=1 Tax=Stylonychia lemnae TaxID=5949 RepID=A0A077ZXL1_STYLE|nr:UNKNOWN [Stylonychia lemnae]|eukprot:CDW74646.1 UNKNOWN [Stylonychia lemnae]
MGLWFYQIAWIYISFLQFIQGSYCPQTTFPLVLGGNSGETHLKSIDMDIQDNIAFAGYSFDSAILKISSNQKLPIMGLIGAGGEYQWAKTSDLNGQEFTTIKFNEAQDQLVVINSIHPLMIIIVQASDGTLLKCIQDTVNLAYPSQDSILSLGSNNDIYFGLQDSNSHYLLASINSGGSSGILFNQVGQPLDLAFGGDHNYAYFAGYLTISGIQTGVIQSTSTVYMKNVVIKYDQVKNQIVQTKRLQYSSGLASCQHIRIISSTQLETIYITPTLKMYQITVDFDTLSATSTYITHFSQSTYYLYTSYQSLNYGLILAGYTNNFGGGPTGIPNQSYGQNIGIIISYSVNYRCLGSSITVLASTPPFTQDSNVMADNSNLYSSQTLTLSESILSFTNINSRQSGGSFSYCVHLKQYECEKVQLTTSIINDQVFDLRLGDGYVIAEVNWPQSYQVECPYKVDVTSIRNEDSLQYTSLSISFISEPTHFQLKSNGLNLDGTYQITIIIKVPSVSDYIGSSNLYTSQIHSTTFQIVVPSLCYYNQVTAIPQLDPIIVQVSNTQVIKMIDFKESMVGCSNLVYSVISTIPSFIIFKSSLKSITVAPAKDTLSNSIDQTDYKIEIVAKPNIIIIDLPTLPDPLEFLGIKDYRIRCGVLSKKNIFLTFEKQLYFHQLFTINFQFGEASSFTKYQSGFLIFEPTDDQQGVYKIYSEIQILSTLEIRLLLFTLTVLPKQKVVQINHTSSSYNTEEIQSPSQIYASIIQISNTGVVIIKFDKEIDTLPTNITQIDQYQTLKIYVRDGLTEVIDLNQQNVTAFELISYTRQNLKLQLYFSFSKGISQKSQKDALVILQLKYPISYHIFTLAAMMVLQQAGSGSKNTLLFAVGINVFLQLASRFSMKLLWRMMSVLQMIVSVPLMGINLPSNVLVGFDQLVGITSLRIIDSATIKRWFFNYLDNSNEGIKDQFNNSDIF